MAYNNLIDLNGLSRFLGKIQDLLADKVDKETGKGLSSNDFTTEEKTKLSGIETGAQVNTITGVKGDAENAYRTGNVSISPTDIGLGNVENKSSATIRSEIESTDVTTALGYTPTPLPSGGSAGDLLAKTANGTEWVTPATAPEEDNTRPITSAAVYDTIGNIESLLSTI